VEVYDHLSYSYGGVSDESRRDAWEACIRVSAGE
jgi:hypothetical protein